jgi:nitrite reductase/ring-hydroxylating ferredoxin subunit
MAKWVEAATKQEFESTDRKMVDLGGLLQIGLYKIDGEYFAMTAWCTHQRATMVHGPLDGFELTCPLHGARFDVRDGRATCLPAVQNAKTYPVKIEDEKIFLKV